MEDLKKRMLELDNQESMICFSADILTDEDKKRLREIRQERRKIANQLKNQMDEE